MSHHGQTAPPLPLPTGNGNSGGVPAPASTHHRQPPMELATLPLAARKPVRLSITIPHGIYLRIEQQASYEGRSMSNLAAHLLEISLSGRID